MKTLLLMILGILTTQTSLASQETRILLVLSGVDYVTLKDGTTHKTGYFLPELTTPLQAALAAGYTVDIATPGGARPTMDRVSDDARWFKSEEDYQAAKRLVESLDQLSSPLNLSKIGERELAQYAGVFFPGGHAPMEDLYKDKEVGRILKHFHAHNKPTALICHAPISLLAAREEGDWIYSGYEMTVFSNAEEKQEEDAGHLDGYLTYYVADALRSAGAKVSIAKPWSSNVVRDRELITGQNPMSDHSFAELFIEALVERRILGSNAAPFRGELFPGNLYEASVGKIDWKNDWVTVYVGARKKSVQPKEFVERLNEHVILVQDAFRDQGLNAYYVFVTNDAEYAIQSWDSQEDAFAAFESAEGQAVIADADEIMDRVLFKEALNPIGL